MNRELLMLVEAISREKNVERDVVIGAVEQPFIGRYNFFQNVQRIGWNAVIKGSLERHEQNPVRDNIWVSNLGVAPQESWWLCLIIASVSCFLSHRARLRNDSFSPEDSGA